MPYILMDFAADNILAHILHLTFLDWMNEGLMKARTRLKHRQEEQEH